MQEWMFFIARCLKQHPKLMEKFKKLEATNNRILGYFTVLK